MVYDYKERDIELFSNQFKAELVNIGEWQIVSGDDICYWYNGDNYYQISGTLGNSCMRYSECECYFDVYKDNAKLLIYTKDDKLLGRAILWKINGKTYMDRVYVCMDYLEEQFIEYAIQNEWYIRTDQRLLSDGDDQKWFGPEDHYKFEQTPNLTIHLTQSYTKFPYMDSFRYFDPDGLTLTTVCDDCYVRLSNTEGYWEDDRCSIECECCGVVSEYFEDDDCPLNWSEYSEEYLCDNCSVWNEFLETYIRTTVNCVNVMCRHGVREIPIDIVEDGLISSSEYHDAKYTDYFVGIADRYYHINALVWDNDKNEFVIDERN